MSDPIIHPTIELPEWLDAFIYDEMNAEFDPLFNRFMACNLSKDELSGRYLGTYFPRSYAEAFSIFGDCFNSYADCLKDETDITVLDFGCGTGGNLLGLLDAIVAYRPSVSKCNVFWCDVSKDSREIFMRVLAEWKKHNPNLVVQGKAHLVEDFTSLAGSASRFSQKGFDIVMSFKVMNEIYQQGYSGNPYVDFYNSFWKLVRIGGLFCLADLTFRHPDNEEGVWLPNLLMKVVPPIEATPIYNTTDHNLFYVKTCKQLNDLEKVVYKLFARECPDGWYF